MALFVPSPPTGKGCNTKPSILRKAGYFFALDPGVIYTGVHNDDTSFNVS